MFLMELNSYMKQQQTIAAQAEPELMGFGESLPQEPKKMHAALSQFTRPVFAQFHESNKCL